MKQLLCLPLLWFLFNQYLCRTWNFDQISKGILGIQGALDIASDVGADVTNSAYTYAKGKLFSTTIEKIKNGEVDAADSDLGELIATLCLIDAPGVVLPAAGIVNDVVTTSSAMTPTQNALKQLSKQLTGILVSDGGDMVASMPAAVSAVSQSKGSVTKSFRTAVSSLGATDSNYLSLSKAAKSMNVGKALDVAGPAFDFIALGYSSFSLGRAARNGDIDTVVESGIAVVGTVISIMSAAAASGSVLGPIGTVAGVIIGGVACLISFLKPNPTADLAKDVEIFETLGKLSIDNLINNYIANPLINIDGKENWLFENNQGAMWKIEAIRPTDPLKFAYNGDNGLSTVTGDVCPRTEEISSECFGVGHTRFIDKSKYGGWFYNLEGRHTLIHERDFYGIPSPPDLPYHGTTIMIKSNHYSAIEQAYDGVRIKTRGVTVDTTPPSSAHKSSGDDVIVIDDLRRLADTEKIILNVGRGKDSININGLVGRFRDDQLSRQLEINTQADGDTPKTTISFEGMENHRTQLQGIIDGIKFTLREDEATACYYKASQNYCPGRITPDIAWITASPFNDKIILYNKKDVIIYNKEGRNTYEVHVLYPVEEENLDKKVLNHIIDTSTEGPILLKVAMNNIEIHRVKGMLGLIYRENKKIFELYRNFGTPEDKYYRLVRRISFAGSTHLPQRVHFGREIDLAQVQRIAEFGHQPTLEIMQHPVFDFTRSVPSTEIMSNANMFCICRPHPEREEAYYFLDMGDGYDRIHLTTAFWTAFPKGEYHVYAAYEKDIGGEDNYQWVIKIRKWNDPDEVLIPRHDITLKNIEHISTTEFSEMILDLTDDDTMLAEIDLWKRIDRLEFRWGGDMDGTDGNDYAIIFPLPDNPGDTDPIHTLDLKSGTDTVVISTAMRGKGYKYLLHEEGDLHDMLIQGNGKTLTIHNAERVACEIDGNIRTMHTWGSYKTFRKLRSLDGECAKVREDIASDLLGDHDMRGVNCEVECDTNSGK